VIERERGRPEAAEALWREAVSIVDRRRQEIEVSGEVQSRYGARYSMLYHQLAGLLVEQGRTIEAWDLLEEVRARALRATIAGRNSIPEGVTPELWFARNRAQNLIERIESRLARTDPVDDEKGILQNRQRLVAAQLELDRILAAIREAAPRYASFSAPKAVGFEDTVRALDAGPAVISYSIGEEDILALVLGSADDSADRLEAFHIPMGSRELSQRVNILHALIARGKAVEHVEEAYVAQARKFFELLVGPALDTVADAERVLIVPYGPLVDVPFAALIVPGSETRFFGHWKTLFVSPSVGVHVGLGSSPKGRLADGAAVVAFGDPEYDARGNHTEVYRLDVLPGTRREIESIEAVFGSGATSFLGAEATERNFRIYGPAAAVLHLAVHSVANPRFPMESALFFSEGGVSDQRADDGALWAWEIVEELELGADVVVLSACSTGRGQTVAGEGVIGLARAFQYAGARTIVAAQWEIPDESTARLMANFYEGLGEGLSTAEALQRAQTELWSNGGALAHPYHWAAFQVRGDWR
jgi:CHAT domain-containing protein